MELLPRILRRAQMRLTWQFFLITAARFLMVAAALALLIGLVLLASGRSPLGWQPALALCGMALAVAVGWTLLRRPSLHRTAEVLDARGMTRDRFQTALRFSGLSARDRFQEAAVEECTRYFGTVDWRRLVRIRFPRQAAVALAPLITLAFLYWGYQLLHQPQQLDAGLQELVSRQGKSLDDLAAKIEQTTQEQQSPQLEQLVQQLKKSAQRLKEQRRSDEEMRKAALREFSSLEALLKEMMRAANLETSPEELQALAEALKRMDQEEAAKDIEEGRYEEASRKLEELMKQLQDRQQGEKTRGQLAASMREAVDRLTEEQKKDVAKQMQQLAESAQAMQDPKVQEALKKLQQLMQELAQSGQMPKQQKQGDPQQDQQGGGRQQQQMPLTAESLQQLIQALENMKRDLQNGQQPSPGEGDMMLSLDLPGQQPKDGSGTNPNANGDPSGNPGSELDFGTTETPFGEKITKAKPEGPAKRLNSVLGEGESLRELVGTAGDDSKAQQRYKEIYNAMQAEAQDSVMQENIPLGSRILIRRYFESIRPKE